MAGAGSEFFETFMSRRPTFRWVKKPCASSLLSFRPRSPVFNRREYFMPKHYFQEMAAARLDHGGGEGGPDIVENILQEAPTG